ncbi:hypothetical protein ACJDU8_08435 [Clostridium sp. WILCCON 0269]|uniref:Uncharacterized protein n=1 Tax=Candidatus Clostridium eludens TaxID=3381663 RepID=A0ABW8SHT4_9CLOT
MSHKKSRNKSEEEMENKDLGYYENKAESLKKTVKHLEKINKRKKEVMKLEKKKRRMVKEMKKKHRSSES